jgi:hypothetical protein
MSTGVVPASEPSVVYEAPDTTHVQELPPVELGGEATQPVDVTVYDDTSDRPAVSAEHITVDRIDPDEQTVIVRTRRDSQTIERVFRLPEIGEQLTLFADSTGLQGSVFGAPRSYETSVITRSIDDPWWRDLGRHIQLAAVFVLALLLAGLITRLV